MAGLTQGQSHRYCVRASGGPLRVTLAWHDYPGDPGAGQLVWSRLDWWLECVSVGGCGGWVGGWLLEVDSDWWRFGCLLSGWRWQLLCHRTIGSVEPICCLVVERHRRCSSACQPLMSTACC